MFVSSSSKCFHQSHCRYLKKTGELSEISLEEARSKNIRACMHCDAAKAASGTTLGVKSEPMAVSPLSSQVSIAETIVMKTTESVVCNLMSQFSNCEQMKENICNASPYRPMSSKKVTLHATAVVTRSDKDGTPRKSFYQSHDPEALAKVGVERNLSTQLFTPRKGGVEVEEDALAIARGILDRILPPAEFSLESNQHFTLASKKSILLLCRHVQKIFESEQTLVHVRAPCKVFGDIHGQLHDLLNFFRTYGCPEYSRGDIAYVNYLFAGDFVDRGSFSLEVICLLFALKALYPSKVTLIRGNHEDRQINSLFGFQQECSERMKPSAGEKVWKAVNDCFDWLPLAAVIEEKIFVCHGGIGDSIHSLDQIAAIQRPIDPEGGELNNREVVDLLWSDPTANDSVIGLLNSTRGDNVVLFGPDKVREFCSRNDLHLIIRAHECVPAGYQFFAEGHLITVFSATNYCDVYDNAGAILVIDSNLIVEPRVITGNSHSTWRSKQYLPPSPMRR